MEREPAMRWEFYYEQGLEMGMSDSCAIQYAKDKMADEEGRRIDAATEAEEVF